MAPVQIRELRDAPGKQLVMAVVTYRPGQASAAHVHDGTVLAYVLEGEVISQLEGQPEHRFKKGDSWYEPPGTPHLISRNASRTRPAKLLAIVMTDQGAPIKRPVTR